MAATSNQRNQNQEGNSKAADPDSLRNAQAATAQLVTYRQAAGLAGLASLEHAADVLGQLLEIAALNEQLAVDDNSHSREINEFVQSHLALFDESNVFQRSEEIEALLTQAASRWPEYVSLIESHLPACDASANEVEWTAQDSSECETGLSGCGEAELEVEAINQLLSAFGEKLESTSSMEPVETELQSNCREPAGRAAPGAAVLRAVNTPGDEVTISPDLLDAFLEDALRGLASMEQAAMTLEHSQSDEQARQQFARELHTLKGASASVGLEKLAARLHQMESLLSDCQPDSPLPAEAMFEVIDRVRSEVARQSKTELKAMPSLPPNGSMFPKAQMATREAVSATRMPVPVGSDEALIRIRVSKFDRLMDMLAELVVLRSRRENDVSQLSNLIEELTRCSARLSHCDERGFGSERDSISEFGVLQSTRSLSEIARDLLVLSRDLQSLQKPLSSDNQAIAGFIRNFRQELMQLRRTPMSGLFARLQRAARDAAKVEGKKVQFRVLGEDTGLEQELQERLYEPLMHLVRNCVSHGIESEANRQRAGKPASGNITIEAKAGPQLLIVEIRDDGQGLNYEAIRRRAIERGLLDLKQTVSNAELTRLIFQPGFSTRDQASQISGRGVGMDVVANTIEQMRGRIDIDSTPSRGTTFRLSIPLRSGIEHVMVFRSAGQLFALPMQAVMTAQSGREVNTAHFSLVDLLSGDSDSGKELREVLLLRDAVRNPLAIGSRRESESRRVGLEVDEIVGPEEVVVRSLPALLKFHPLFCGLTLSGANEPVMLLDAHRLLDFYHRHLEENALGRPRPIRAANREQTTRRALVVDDSLSARKALVKKLSQLGFHSTEASDGIEGLERLRHESFDLIFTDLDMPRLGGLEMMFDIQRGNYGEAPIVVVSSRGAKEFRDQAIEHGAVEFLSKPVSEEHLQQVLVDLGLVATEGV